MSNKRIFLSPPHMGGTELDLIHEAFESNYIAPIGPMIEAFEQEFAALVEQPYVTALSCGTAAIHLAMRHLGVGPGDTVLASTLTFIGSVSPATFLGAELGFIDADPSNWCMDPNLLAEELADRAKHGNLPKVVIPTDLYGQCADMDQISAVCAPYHIPVIADSAEALGATYKSHPAGQPATATIFSFNGNKIITTGGGGILASADEELIRHARHLATQARDPEPYYQHTEIGYNYRMSNIAAAIGCGQLAVLEQRVAQKRVIFERYQERLKDLPGITFMPEAPYGKSTRWLTVILIDEAQLGASPETIRIALEAENIEARPVWKPMHLQPIFKTCSIRGGRVSEDLFKRGLCLPSGTAMTETDIDRVTDGIRRCSHI